MRVIITTVQAPFISGGAELHAAGLLDAIRKDGHSAEIVQVPFRFSPPSDVEASIAYWEQQNFEWFDCGKIDRVISLKFPTYYLKHSNKVVWLLHQFSGIYEFLDTPFGISSKNDQWAPIRTEIVNKDTKYLSQITNVFTVSKHISNVLHENNGIHSQPLMHPPPLENQCRSDGEIYPYIFAPSRLELQKRQYLLIEAMKYVIEPIVAVLAGTGGEEERYRRLAVEHGVSDRVKFVGMQTGKPLINYYRNALGVFFCPFSEPYGYITLEAMLSAKAVITCNDSCGPTDFVIDGETGYVAAPDPLQIAEAINRLWADRRRAAAMGKNGLQRYMDLGISWSNVVDTLLR